MNLVRLIIKGISYSQTQSGAYALVLSEAKGNRTLPIVIGAFEAQAIAIAIEEEIKPPRPLTHDLFKSFADSFNINVKQIVIHKLIDGVFYSSIICESNGVEKNIDARTSDAIALATRFNAPIFTYETILEKAGIYLQVKDEEESDINSQRDQSDENYNSKVNFILDDIIPEKEDTSFLNESLEELKNNLNEAVKNEDYELAARLRDEINKRGLK